MYKCKLTSNCPPKTVSLGRPWIPSSSTGGITPKVLFRECELGAHITASGWTSMSGNNPENFEMWEYMNTGVSASTSRKQVPSSRVSEYTMEKFLTGSDSWNPIKGSDAPVIIQDGKFIKALVIKDQANAADWSVQSNLQVGDAIYGDRTYKFTQIHQKLLGAEWIRTACESKNFTGEMASFTTKTDISVFVGLDTRITDIPAWLDSWVKTDESLNSDNSVTFNVYKKDFASNEVVTFGTNSSNSGTVNYTISVLQKTVPTSTIGDPNNDGAIDALDFALMKRYLLNNETVDINLRAADINSDGIVNAIDLAAMKILILSKS